MREAMRCVRRVALSFARPAQFVRRDYYARRASLAVSIAIALLVNVQPAPKLVGVDVVGVCARPAQKIRYAMDVTNM